MSDVIQRCVPLSTGALGPDLRVNYHFGLVLGVDEFEQEDRYFRERDERHTRGLHGFGTVSGLHVTAGRPTAAPDDVEVRVTEGVAIDQFGRPIVLRSAQCGRIGAWIAAEEQRAVAENRRSPLALHRTDSGDIPVFVVASYDSCEDALVPMPSNPCGSDDEVTAPSRIRDSWNLEFRWESPAMPAWDGIGKLADLLLRIEFDDDPSISHEEQLATHVRALHPESPEPDPLPHRPVLPRADAREVLDQLLTLWLTEVRPALLPNLLAPEGEAGVLLSFVRVRPAQSFDSSHPVIDRFGGPYDRGRPYLAPTQLIQELALLGAAAPQSQIELASLATGIASQSGHTQLLLRSHLDSPLILPPSVSVQRGEGSIESFEAQPRDEGFTWVLSPTGGPLADHELLTVKLDLSEIEVGIADAHVRLLAYLEQEGLNLVGRKGSRLDLRHQVQAGLAVPPSSPPRDVREIVSVMSVVDPGATVPAVEVWFHFDSEPSLDEQRISALSPDKVQVWGEVERDSTPIPVSVSNMSVVQHNVFRFDLDGTDWRRDDGTGYLRIVLLTDKIDMLGGKTVFAYLQELDVAIPGFVTGVPEPHIVAYLRVSGRS